MNKVIKFNLSKPIVFIGMMGSGKSYISSALSNILGIDLYDIDILIEEDQGTIISNIFKDRGESYFRELEKNKIAEFIDNTPCIISTGGGAVTTPQNLDIIKSKSISVWLKSDIDTILSRVKSSNSRPLLNCENPYKKLENLLHEREKLYALADIHIDNSSSDIEHVIENIILELRKYNAEQNS